MADVLELNHQKHRYKLYYFDIKGRGEPIRLLFFYFRVKFDDIKITPDEWPKKKMKAPMQQLPYIEVDKGRLVLCQSEAIMRFLAKTFRPGFAGKSKSDSARVDMYGAGAFEMFHVFTAVASSRNSSERDTILEATAPRITTFCDVYSSHLTHNGNQYINGAEITWADLVLVFVLSALDDLANNILKANALFRYKELVQYYLRMRELREIKEFVDERWKPSNLQ